LLTPAHNLGFQVAISQSPSGRARQLDLELHQSSSTATQREVLVHIRPNVTLILGSLLLVPALAAAQDFGVMESAETINRGNFKLKANPMFVVGRDDADNETGVALSAGYGFTRNVDAEAKLAFYEGLLFFGGDVEVNVMSVARQQPLDLSIGGGFHIVNHDDDFSDARAFDLTLLGSKLIANRLELYGALDFAFNTFTDEAFDDADDFGIDDSYTSMHLVPGIEYSLSPDVDLLAEFGIALNDDSSHYFSAGIAYYLR